VTATFTRAQLDSFRNLVVQRLGLTFEETRVEYLTDALRGRVAASGAHSTEHYLARLTQDSAANHCAELRTLATLLTVGETYFFRNSDHFRALTGLILPKLLEARQAERSMRFLSAGCSSGEEAFTLAILLRETIPDLSAWRITIQGIDINPAALEKASLARYSTWSLRETPAPMRARYFHQSGKDFVLNPEVREMVQFEERNLTDADATFWRAGQFDVVFCRNVMMYFPSEVSRLVVERIARSLRGDGHLFLGHAETLRGLSNEFHLRHTHDTFYYQKRGVQELEALKPELELRSSSPPALADARADSFARAAPYPDAPVHSLAGSVALGEALSWVDAIQRASDHIAHLAGTARGTAVAAVGATRPAPSAAAAATTPRTWDTQQALQLLREERFGEALSVLGKLPEESRGDPDAQLLRAVLLTNTGDLGAAERTCEQLLAHDELNAGAHYLTALAREHVGDLTGAIEHDQAAAYLDPSFAMPRLHLGLLARRAKNVDVARQELQRALSLLLREEAARILLFGGGFSRETLSHLCRTELQALERHA
jgi:chemotaxis protein methyltransferase CheR